MNKSIKSILVSILLLCSTTAFAQGVDIVTLTTMGEGRTQSEAVTNALRNAVEQAFGAFVSSRTDIVNDELIRDEIVSVASGNIRRHNVLSSVTLPNGYTAVTVRADVSVARLTAFSQGRGIDVEFAGATFGANIRLMQMYERNTIAVLNNLISTIEGVIMNCFDYTISVSDPVRNRSGNWEIAHTVHITPNRNMANVHRLIVSTLSGISMSRSEVENYISLGKGNQIVPIAIVPNNRRIFGYDSRTYGTQSRTNAPSRVNRRHIDYFHLRTGREQVTQLLNVVKLGMYNFIVDNGVVATKFELRTRQHRFDEYLFMLGENNLSFDLHQYYNGNRHSTATNIRVQRYSFLVYRCPIVRPDSGRGLQGLPRQVNFSFQTRDLSSNLQFGFFFDLSLIERMQRITVRPIIE